VTAIGKVYDRGYRPYEGPRRGRAGAIAALWRATMRRSLGLGRSWRHKVMPWLLLAIATVPAAVFVGVAYLTREANIPVRLITYREYVGVSSSLMLFVAIAAPDALCPDRRQRVLPLILSRPLTGIDYAVAKVAALFTVVFAFSFIPQVVLFVGQMLVSDRSLDYLRENAEVLWQSPLAVAVLALYFAILGLASAAITSRRVIGGANFIGLLLVTNMVTGAITATRPGGTSMVNVANLLGLPLYVRDLIFLGRVGFDTRLTGIENGGLFAVVGYSVVILVCAAILALRYRWAER
jgi:ABC-2 type transport system permease protein